MACLIAVEGYGLWRLSSNHCVGEIVRRDWVGRSDDSKLREANISSNSENVDAVIEAVAASAFARR